MLRLTCPSGQILRLAKANFAAQQRNSSFKRVLANIFARKSQTMSTVEQLELERQKLEERVRHLVGQLESQKGPDEIRLKEDQILKSKDELAAAAAMEKLEIKEAAEKAAVKAPAATEPPAKATAPKGGKKGGAPAAKEPEKPLDVSRLDLRIGKMLEVSRHPDADALYVEKIDCGDSTGPRTVISGLVKHIPIEEMQGRTVVVLCNLKPAKMRGILSEAMVMCASTEEKVELIQPPPNAKPGDRVIFEAYPGEPDAQLNPKKKIWEQIAPDLKTNNEGVAMYKDCPFKLPGADGLFKSNLAGVQIR